MGRRTEHLELLGQQSEKLQSKLKLETISMNLQSVRPLKCDVNNIMSSLHVLVGGIKSVDSQYFVF